MESGYEREYKLIDNKAKGQISKWVLQENKAGHNFQKTNISHHTSDKKLEMFVFRKIWRALFSCNTRFEIRIFALLPTNSASKVFNFRK